MGNSMRLLVTAVYSIAPPAHLLLLVHTKDILVYQQQESVSVPCIAVSCFGVDCLKQKGLGV